MSRPATVARLSLFAAPALSLAATALAAPIRSDERAQLAAIAVHPDRWYWSTILLLAGALLTVPAVLGIAAVARERSPRLGDLGGGLALLGALIAIGDVMGQLTVWQMVAPGADRAQMAALLHRTTAATGVAVVFTVGGLAIVLGALVLAIGLRRGRVVPLWAAVAFVAGMILNLAGYGASSNAVVGASWVVLLAAWAPVARRLTPWARVAPA